MLRQEQKPDACAVHRQNAADLRHQLRRALHSCLRKNLADDNDLLILQNRQMDEHIAPVCQLLQNRSRHFDQIDGRKLADTERERTVAELILPRFFLVVFFCCAQTTCVRLRGCLPRSGASLPYRPGIRFVCIICMLPSYPCMCVLARRARQELERAMELFRTCRKPSHRVQSKHRRSAARV